MKTMTMTEIRKSFKEEIKMINMVQKAYIKTYGIEKWNGLTDKEKHDAVMIIIKDALRFTA